MDISLNSSGLFSDLFFPTFYIFTLQSGCINAVSNRVHFSPIKVIICYNLMAEFSGLLVNVSSV